MEIKVDPNQKLLPQLKAFLKSPNHTKPKNSAAIAEKMGISRSGVTRREKGEADVTTEWLGRYLKALGYDEVRLVYEF